MDLYPLKDAVNRRQIGDVMIQPGQVWQHFKGGLYIVIGVARNSETLEDEVIYKDMYGLGQLWARPLSMWNENINRGAYSGPRFKYVRG